MSNGSHPGVVASSGSTSGSGSELVVELTEQTTEMAYDAMVALRPDIGNVVDFVERVRLQQAYGYRLAAVLDQSAGAAVAVAGFRLLETLGWGRCLYVDDLTTIPAARQAGHGTALLLWLQQEALRLGCDAMHLDSNVGEHRSSAHRLYLKVGMTITSLHFAIRLDHDLS